MKKFFNLILFVLILLMFVNINMVLATDSAQIQNVEQNVDQSVDKTKTVDSMGIYKMPDDLTYSDSSRIYLNNGIILFKYNDGTEQLVDMMSPDIEKNVNFDGDSDNIVISFVYNNVIINGNVLLQKSTDTIMHNTVVGAGAGDSIRGFDIKVAPKYSYIQNYDKLDLKRGVLEVFYSDGSLGIVKMTDPEVVVEGFDNSVPGIQELTVKYKGFENKFKIEIVENHNPLLNGNLNDKIINNNNSTVERPKFFRIENWKSNNTNTNSNISFNANNTEVPRVNGPDNTMAKGLLPQTGALPIVLFIILIFVILIIVSFYKKLGIKNGIRGK